MNAVDGPSLLPYHRNALSQQPSQIVEPVYDIRPVLVFKLTLNILNLLDYQGFYYFELRDLFEQDLAVVEADELGQLRVVGLEHQPVFALQHVVDLALLPDELDLVADVALPPLGLLVASE